MIRICERLDMDLQVIWIKNQDLGSFFTDLYKLIQHPSVNVEIHNFEKQPFKYSDRLMDNPRQRIFNSMLRIYQRVYFDKVFHASQTARLKSEGYDFISGFSRFKSIYVSSWGRIDHGTFNSSLFKPVDEIVKAIPSFQGPVIGVHVRRSDHQQVIEKTPLVNFFRIMDHEVKKDPKLRLFVASDSEEVKAEMVKKYGNKIIMNSSIKAERTTQRGMFDAMIDLYSLANTQKIIGTSVSTFTKMASEIKGIELIEIGQ